MRRLPGQDLLLGEEHVLERVGREGRRAIGAHRRAAERHQAAPHRLRRPVVVGHDLLDPGHPGRAEHQRQPRGRHLIGRDRPRRQHRGDRQRRHDPPGHLDEGHVAAGRPVGVVGEAGVADPAGRAGQRRKRRGQQRTAFGKPGDRPPRLQRRDVVERRLDVLRRVDEPFARRLGGEDHVARPAHRVDQRGVALGAGPGRAADVGRALGALAEEHVVDHQRAPGRGPGSPPAPHAPCGATASARRSARAGGSSDRRSAPARWPASVRRRWPRRAAGRRRSSARVAAGGWPGPAGRRAAPRPP